jgi:chromosome segregation ATPase
MSARTRAAEDLQNEFDENSHDAEAAETVQQADAAELRVRLVQLLRIVEGLQKAVAHAEARAANANLRVEEAERLKTEALRQAREARRWADEISAQAAQLRTEHHADKVARAWAEEMLTAERLGGRFARAWRALAGGRWPS